jgi:hypothetical protein
MALYGGCGDGHALPDFGLLVVSRVGCFSPGFYGARALWIAIHKWGGLALSVVVLMHVALHWTWLMRMTRRHLARVLRRPQGGARRLPERAD